MVSCQPGRRLSPVRKLLLCTEHALAVMQSAAIGRGRGAARQRLCNRFFSVATPVPPTHVNCSTGLCRTVAGHPVAPMSATRRDSPPGRASTGRFLEPFHYSFSNNPFLATAFCPAVLRQAHP
jgi:hypothetical protein